MRSDEKRKESQWEIESNMWRYGRCCAQGERFFCVCMVAMKCPVHGNNHVGTHD